MSMTAAGTLAPTRVLVLGAGVAGLQAIATAKRLGAVVSANDVRAASADEVRSVGGTFIDLDLETADASGGYAKALGEDRARRQQELLTPHLVASDIVITTAAVPGRAAPRLVTTAMLAGMRSGSVLVDLAAESGGNIEGSVPGERRAVEVNGGTATLIGARNIHSDLPVDASKLLGMNYANFLVPLLREGTLDARLRRRARRRLRPHPRGRRHAPPHRRTAGRSGPLMDAVRPHHDHRARHLPRLRGRLEGLEHPAHPADVGGQCHPRHHPARRDHGGGSGRRARHADPVDHRRPAGHHERRGRIRRDRPDAGHVLRRPARSAREGQAGGCRGPPIAGAKAPAASRTPDAAPAKEAAK